MNRKERRRQQKLAKKGIDAGGGWAPPQAPPDTAQLAFSHYQARRLPDALRAAQQALRIQPDNIDMLHLAGCIVMELEEFEPAITYLNTVVAKAPDFAEAHDNLGNALRISGRLDEAAAAFGKAVSLKPDFAAAHSNLGIVLEAQRDFPGAEAAYRRALDVNPGFARAHNNLGQLLQQLEKFDEAGSAYRRALELEPNFAEANNNLGTLLKELGKFDEAEAAFRRALAINPDFASCFANLADLKTFASDDADIAAAERVMTKAGITDAQRLDLHFGLGKAYEDQHDCDRAFANWEKGNRIKRRSLAYDAGTDEANVEHIINTFNRPELTRLAGHGCQSEAPIFVVGMPRSGTTLVEQILSSHTDVFGAGEMPHFIRLYLDSVGGMDRDKVFPESGALEALGQSYIDAVGQTIPPTPRFTDKLTENFRAIGLIYLVLPNAKIVHCLRDPVDTCLSCFKTNFVNDVDFAYDLTELGRHYRARDRLMEHWHAVLPGPMFDIRYEDVVDDLEGQARALLEFCGLPWEDACLDFHRNERPVRTASAAQVRKPIYKDSVRRWKRYEDHLAPLLDALEPLVK